MEDTHYDGINAHKTAHKLLKDQIKNYKDTINFDKDELRKALFDFMSGWIIKHIIVEDPKYRSHFHKNGLCSDVSRGK